MSARHRLVLLRTRLLCALGFTPFSVTSDTGEGRFDGEGWERVSGNRRITISFERRRGA